ncbi:2'-5' RNA ligase family protein [Roseomonas elaeocarpi]|uniref:2'-5' RNA ligase family protein n=1 Tax=Roseomonas elaeocarpi TaxID=907779 RepID=A0ABV6JMP5_9PROT
MPYAISLLFDDTAAAHVRRMWCALAEQVGSDDAIRLGYPPHMTLAVLPDTAPIADVEEAAFRVTGKWTTLSVVLAGLGVFPRTRPVIWAAPVVTSELLARHADLHAALMPFGVHPHYRPGSWVPHVTLSQEGAVSADRAIEAAGSAWSGPVSAECRQVELVRFRPVDVLRSQALLEVQ